MFKASQIAELQARIATLEADLQTSNGNAATLQGQLDGANAALALAQGEVASLNVKITAAALAQKAAEDAAAAAQASVPAQVTTQLAAAGVDPVARDPQAKSPDEGGRAANASLPPMKRAAAAIQSNFGKVFGGQ